MTKNVNMCVDCAELCMWNLDRAKNARTLQSQAQLALTVDPRNPQAQEGMAEDKLREMRRGQYEFQGSASPSRCFFGRGG